MKSDDSDYQPIADPPIGPFVAATFESSDSRSKYDIPMRKIAFLLRTGVATMKADTIRPTRKGMAYLRAKEKSL